MDKPEILENEEVSQEEPTPEEELDTLRQELEEKTALAEEHYDQFLRAKADFENLRKRSRLEKLSLMEYSSEKLLIDLLPVLDNFERALADKSGDLKSYKIGVEMIYKQLKEVLEDEGLRVIPAENQEFDPRVHDAVMTEENSELSDNTVMEELRVGYYYKDKVIRPSMVKVAKQ